MMIMDKVSGMQKQSPDDVLEFCNDKAKDVVIMPAGIHGQMVYEKYLKPYGHKIKYFVDNNPAKQGKIIDGIKVLSFDEFLKEKENLKMLIATNLVISEILQEQIAPHDIEFCYAGGHLYYYDLKSLANPSECLNARLDSYKVLYNSLEDDLSKKTLDKVLEFRFNYKDLTPITEIKRPMSHQYFESEIYQVSEKDCIVDCGAYTGDTLESCLNFAGGKVEKYFAFEPSENNYNQLINKKYDFVKAIPMGVSDKHAVMYFQNGGDAGSQISEIGDTKIEVDAIDNILKDEKVTFIKMDIEGAEIDALKGAQNIIKNQKPNLAISVYHRFDDIFDIPELIRSFGVNYKYYLRHYDNSISETVLYAINK